MGALEASLAVGSALAVAGILAFTMRPSRRANALLAAVLLLQAASTAAYAFLAAATTRIDATPYARMGVWASIAIPFVTVALVHALLPRTGPWPPRILVGLGAATVGALILQVTRPAAYIEAVVPFGDGYTITSGAGFYILAAVSALAQAYAVWHAWAAAKDADNLPHRRATLLALAFALLPVYSAGFFVTNVLLQLPGPFADLYLLRVGGTLAAAAILLGPLVALLGRVDRAPRRLAYGLLVALCLVGLADGALGAQPGLRGSIPGYDRSVPLLRIAFAFTIILAALRFGTADAGDRERRHAYRVVRIASLGAVAIGVGALVLSVLGVNLLGASLALVAAVGVPAALRAPTTQLADALSRVLLLARDDPRAIAERARTYAAAVAAAEGAGAEGSRYLATLREDLGISDREHDLLVHGVASRDATRYQKTESLAAGATSEVELAVDEIAGRRVVIKRFKGVRNPAAALAEARALAAVRHPRIIPFIEVDRRGDDLHLVLAYADGGSARQLLDREGPLPPARAVALTRDLLEGLDALHAAGITHCDVKPENLLLDIEGRGMLGDLGSARFAAPDLADATLTGGTAEGSLSTISPEAVRGVPPAPTRDVYAAGAVLYRLLTGEHYVDLDAATVFQARERILMDAPRLPHPLVPAGVEPVLRKALAKRPEERYRSAREMMIALQ